jgi:hypothetical protein
MEPIHRAHRGVGYRSERPSAKTDSDAVAGVFMPILEGKLGNP